MGGGYFSYESLHVLDAIQGLHATTQRINVNTEWRMVPCNEAVNVPPKASRQSQAPLQVKSGGVVTIIFGMTYRYLLYGDRRSVNVIDAQSDYPV